MTYKQLTDAATGRTVITTVNAEGHVLFIPESEANTDYQRYLAWVAEGNTAEVVES